MKIQYASKERVFSSYILPSSFYLLISGDMLSRIGDYIYQLAIPLFVLYVTGSSVWMGIVFGVQESALVFMGIFAGAILDRYNIKRLIMWNAVIQILLVSLLPVLYILRILNIYIIIIIGFMLSCSGFFYRAGNNALIPRILTKDQLQKASGQISISKALSKTFGPTIAGAIIALVTPIHSLWFDAISFAILLLFVSFLRLNDSKVDSNKPVENERKRLWIDIRDGFVYIFMNYIYLLMVIFNFLLNLGFVSMYSMFIYHLKRSLGFSAQCIGIIMVSDGVAAFIAGLLIPMMLSKIKNGYLMIFSGCFLGISIFLLGFVRNPFLVSICFGGVMFGSQISNRTMYTVWQMTIPKNMLGRIFSLSTMLESISVPLAGVLGGVIAMKFGSFNLMRISGLVAVFSALLLLGTRLRTLDNRMTH
ncbi:MFS transporter [Alicyclobacillus fructus]|uniref:MFS transporter n=1 Tax=Alicyclobacillus fructus TaxID=2816082 RepID=UPI001A8F630C|nr:MFS transporter [Alicyclobacillus fructus]